MNYSIARISAIGAALALAVSSASWACPLTPAPDAQLAQVLRGHGIRVSASPKAILFRSKMALDDDGAPNAYHRGNADDSPDPGLDHICSGADVLEFRSGRLVNKYGEAGSIGALGGVDPITGIGRSRLCKRDYIAIRDAGFPRCGSGRLCMRFYGVAVEPRACGYNRAHQTGCGVPILQRNSLDNSLPFYLSTNTLLRPGADGNSRIQADFADATRIPFIVMPGGLRLPGGMRWQPGDLAVVVANGRTAFAVIGDTGPAIKLGEGSRALLQALGIRPTDRPDAVTTLLFPGTAARITGPWPLNPTSFERHARAMMEQFAGGKPAMRRCVGLGDLQ